MLAQHIKVGWVVVQVVQYSSSYCIVGQKIVLILPSLCYFLFLFLPLFPPTLKRTTATSINLN